MYRIALIGSFNALVLFVLSACQTAPSKPPPAPTAKPAPTYSETVFFSDTRDDVPAEQSELRTTSGSIYLNNLKARIVSLRQAIETRGEAPIFRLLLARSLQHRGRILGHTNDLEKALIQINRVILSHPDNANAYMARASLYSMFHRFDEAMAELDKAESLGVPEARLAPARASVLIALGDVARGEASAEPWLEEKLVDLAFRGNRRLAEGRLEKADRLFSKAQAVYDDTNPVALAWLDIQHGVAFLRNSMLQRAREFFAAAHARMPQYYLATEHLAETELLLGNYRRAAELYRQVSEQTGNPVFYAKLVEAERALDNEQASARADAQARAGFEAWLDRHPEAAWQHTAKYYLSREEIGRALTLARLNADLRQNIPSLLLLARAELAAGNEEMACNAWGRVLESAAQNELNPPEIGQHENEFAYCE